MFELIVTSKVAVAVLARVPPVQVRVTLPTDSASPSTRSTGTGLRDWIHVCPDAWNEIRINSAMTADTREGNPVLTILCTTEASLYFTNVVDSGAKTSLGGR
jgi:hypothetical protein